MKTEKSAKIETEERYLTDFKRELGLQLTSADAIIRDSSDRKERLQAERARIDDAVRRSRKLVR